MIFALLYAAELYALLYADEHAFESVEFKLY